MRCAFVKCLACKCMQSFECMKAFQHIALNVVLLFSVFLSERGQRNSSLHVTPTGLPSGQVQRGLLLLSLPAGSTPLDMSLNPVSPCPCSRRLSRNSLPRLTLPELLPFLRVLLRWCSDGHALHLLVELCASGEEIVEH